MKTIIMVQSTTSGINYSRSQYKLMPNGFKVSVTFSDMTRATGTIQNGKVSL